jgi:hypothetical protein
MLAMMMATALALQSSPEPHASHGASAAAQAAATSADENAVRAVLARYKSAIKRLDASGTEALFTEDSAVFETGWVEGTYRQYLAHHLGPELAAFRAFAFSDYTVVVLIPSCL